MRYIKDVKKNKPYNIFLIVEFILCFFMIYGVLWDKTRITSAAFVVSFITLLAAFIKINFEIKEVKMLWQVILIFLVSAICVIISFIHNDKPFEFDSIKEYLIFMTAIIYMFMCCHIDINRKTMNYILIFNVAIGYLYYIAYRIAPKVNIFSVGIDLNFGNPNFAGMWLFQSMLYCTIALIVYKQPIMKVYSGLSLLLLLRLLNKTGARNCQLAFLLFIAVCLWLRPRKDGKFPKWIIVIINILPIIFVPLYLKFIEPISQKGWFSFLVSRGKTLSSRVKVWNHFFEKLGNRWLIGEYITCLGNSHNSHMVVLCSYGLITLILVIVFTYTISMRANEQAKDKRNGYCLAAFFATLFMGFGEGALFAGGIGLYIMGCSFICLARYDFLDFDQVDYDKNNPALRRYYQSRLIKDRKRNIF